MTREKENNDQEYNDQEEDNAQPLDSFNFYPDHKI